MIHYNVWFNIRSDVQEQEGLLVIQSFLHELSLAGEIAGFKLLRNSGSAARTQMLPFHAVIEFQDDAQFSAAFASQATRGIHTGLHGRVMTVVEEIRVEVFRQIAISSAINPDEFSHQYACEV